MRKVLTLVAVAGSVVIGHAQTGEQDLKLTLTSNGQARAYRVFVPDGFGKSAPGPAVVLFNGSGRVTRIRTLSADRRWRWRRGISSRSRRWPRIRSSTGIRSRSNA